ncbi:uncharacterized protein [Physcomitrium patens]|uniref:uncharacterized protein isoform X4 n=1 Tax=Physcomitrium patens TaxID=3218 RepID=UPI003CCC986E
MSRLVLHQATVLLEKPLTLSVDICGGMFPRLDPLNHLKKYRGGFDVTNMHYWSSLAYTGIWGYIIAASCLIFGVGSVIWQHYNWRYELKKTTFNPSLDKLHSVSVYCMIQFSILLLGASGVILWENDRLVHELKKTGGILVSTVDQVTLQVDGAINMIPLSNISPMANQDMAKSTLSACNNLGDTFRNLTQNVKSHMSHAYKIFDIVNIVVSMVASLMILMVIIGIGSIFQCWHTFLSFMCFGAVFTLVASWMIAGIGFAVAILVVDGCQAMQSYNKSPLSSSITHLLPCLTPQRATEVLSGVKKAIKTVIHGSNSWVDVLNMQERKLVERHRLSHPTIVPHICDPYGPEPEFIPMECSPAEGSFVQFVEDYKKYCCLSDDINDCFKKSTPIPKFAFLDATRAMNATKNVYMILPTIFHIITCDFMKLMFEEIIKQHCMPLKKCLTMLWVSFVSASLLLMLLLFCIIYIKYKLFNTPNLISDVGNSKNKITLSFCKPDV